MYAEFHGHIDCAARGQPMLSVSRCLLPLATPALLLFGMSMRMELGLMAGMVVLMEPVIPLMIVIM